MCKIHIMKCTGTINTKFRKRVLALWKGGKFHLAVNVLFLKNGR